jgi:arsenate reductase (thioredoxin)
MFSSVVVGFVRIVQPDGVSFVFSQQKQEQRKDPRTTIFPRITTYLQECEKLFHTLPKNRVEELQRIAIAITAHTKQSGSSSLIFICTHNSRRSHLAQIWAKVAADYYDISGVTTYSGGTEVTAFHPNAITALRNAGFDISHGDSTSNPMYSVRYSSVAPALSAFSKRYNDTHNPSQEFFAVMTCSDADKACPFVVGAKERFSLPYEDPKIYDRTPQQDARYAKRCKQIATEMLYIFSRVR